MNISEVSLMRRRNLGNYEHIESSVTIALVEGDDEKLALSKAKDFISEAIGLTANKPSTKTAQTKTSTNAKPSTKKEEDPKKEEAKKPAAKKATTKKAPAAKVTKEDVTEALKAYAKAKKSKDMAVEVMHDVTGVRKLDEVDAKMYTKLVKALAV